MNVLKRRALILTLLVLCLFGLTILGASAAVDTAATGTTTQETGSVASATVTVGEAEPQVYYYTDLATAIAEADDGTTVTLLGDTSVAAGITLDGRTVTVDGGNFTLTTSAGPLFTIKNGTALTVKDLTIMQTFVGSNTDPATAGSVIRVDETGSDKALTVNFTNVKMTAASSIPFYFGGDSVIDFNIVGGSYSGKGMFGVGTLNGSTSVASSATLNLTVAGTEAAHVTFTATNRFGDASALLFADGSTATINANLDYVDLSSMGSGGYIIYLRNGGDIILDYKNGTVNGMTGGWTFASQASASWKAVFEGVTLNLNGTNGGQSIRPYGGTGFASYINFIGCTINTVGNLAFSRELSVTMTNTVINHTGTSELFNCADATAVSVTLNNCTYNGTAKLNKNVPSMTLNVVSYKDAATAKLNGASVCLKNGNLYTVYGDFTTTMSAVLSGDATELTVYILADIAHSKDVYIGQTAHISLTLQGLDLDGDGVYPKITHNCNRGFRIYGASDLTLRDLNMHSTARYIQCYEAGTAENPINITFDNVKITESCTNGEDWLHMCQSYVHFTLTETSSITATYGARSMKNNVFTITGGSNQVLDLYGDITLNAETLSDDSSHQTYLVYSNVASLVVNVYENASIVFNADTTKVNTAAFNIDGVVNFYGIEDVQSADALAKSLDLFVRLNNFAQDAFSYTSNLNQKAVDNATANATKQGALTILCDLTPTTAIVLGDGTDDANFKPYDLIIEGVEISAGTYSTLTSRGTDNIKLYDGSDITFRNITVTANHRWIRIYNTKGKTDDCNLVFGENSTALMNTTSASTEDFIYAEAKSYVNFIVEESATIKMTQTAATGRKSVFAFNGAYGDVIIRGTVDANFTTVDGAKNIILFAMGSSSGNIIVESTATVNFKVAGGYGTPYFISGACVASIDAAVKINGAVLNDTSAKAINFNVRATDGNGTTALYANVMGHSMYVRLPDVTTITLLNNVTAYNMGTDDTTISKKITITSIEGQTYTVNAAHSIPFYMGNGGDLTLTNVTYDLSGRFARVDGSSNITFGAGCTVNSNADIFIYNNGNGVAGGFAYTIDFLAGSVINATGNMGKGLIYHNSDAAAGADVTVKIAGTINISTASYLIQDVNSNGKYTIVYDASSASVTCGLTPCVANKGTIVFTSDETAIMAGYPVRLGSTVGGNLNTVYFQALADAITAAKTGDTVYVLANTTSAALTIDGKSVTIIGSNNATLTTTGTITLKGGATLAIEDLNISAPAITFAYLDNASLTITGKTAKPAISANTFATFTTNGALSASNIEVTAYYFVYLSGTAKGNISVTVTDSAINNVIRVINNAKNENAPTLTAEFENVTITGATVNASGNPEEACLFEIAGDGSGLNTASTVTFKRVNANFNGRVLTSSSGRNIGTVYIEDCNFTTSHAHVLRLYGTTKYVAKNSTFKSTATSGDGVLLINVATVSGEFTNCTFEGTGTNPCVNVPPATTATFDGCTFTHTDATKIVASNTNATVIVKNNCLVNGKAIDDATAGKGGLVARIGNTYYNSLLTAVANAADGDTIYVLGDATVGNITLAGKNVTIEGVDNVTLTASADVFSLAAATDKNATLTLKNLSFTLGAYHLINATSAVAGTGAHTVEMINVNATANADAYIIYVNNAAANLDLTVTNGTFVGKRFMHVQVGSAIDFDLTGTTVKASIFYAECRGLKLGTAEDPITLTDVTVDHNNGATSGGFTFRENTTNSNSVVYIAVFGGSYNLRPVDATAAYTAEELCSAAFITIRDGAACKITLTINKGSDETTAFYTAGYQNDNGGADGNNSNYSAVIAVNGHSNAKPSITIDAYNATFKAYSKRSALVAVAGTAITGGLSFTNCSFDTVSNGFIFIFGAAPTATLNNCTVVSGQMNTTAYTLTGYANDKAVLDAGFGPFGPVRFGTTEGTATVYYGSLNNAIAAIPANGAGVVTLISNASFVGPIEIKNKEVTITATTSTITLTHNSGWAAFWLFDGSKLTLENVTLTLQVVKDVCNGRFARTDGDTHVIFGNGCTVNCSADIFIYTNNQGAWDITATYDFQAGSVINWTSASGSMIYHDGTKDLNEDGDVKDSGEKQKLTLNVYISGELNVSSTSTGAITYDKNDNSSYIVWIDFTTAKITCTATYWFYHCEQRSPVYMTGLDTIEEYDAVARKTSLAVRSGAKIGEGVWVPYTGFRGQINEVAINVLPEGENTLYLLEDIVSINSTIHYKGRDSFRIVSNKADGTQATITFQGDAYRFRVYSGSVLTLDNVKIVTRKTSSDEGKLFQFHNGTSAVPATLILTNGSTLTSKVPAAALSFADTTALVKIESTDTLTNLDTFATSFALKLRVVTETGANYYNTLALHAANTATANATKAGTVTALANFSVAKEYLVLGDGKDDANFTTYDLTVTGIKVGSATEYPTLTVSQDGIRLYDGSNITFTNINIYSSSRWLRIYNTKCTDPCDIVFGENVTASQKTSTSNDDFILVTSGSYCNITVEEGATLTRTLTAAKTTATKKMFSAGELHGTITIAGAVTFNATCLLADDNTSTPAYLFATNGADSAVVIKSTASVSFSATGESAGSSIFIGDTHVTVEDGATVNGTTYESARLAAQALGLAAEYTNKEDGKVYYVDNVTYALQNAKDKTTVTLLRDASFKDVITVDGKDLTITSIPGSTYTLTQTDGWAAFCTKGGAKLTLENITLTLQVNSDCNGRFARIDGSTHVIFGDGATVNTAAAIFIYNNGNGVAGGFAYTIDFLAGSVINATGNMGNGLIYHNSEPAANADVTVNIAGTINIPTASPITKDVDANGKYVVNYDASTADITCGAPIWFSTNTIVYFENLEGDAVAEFALACGLAVRYGDVYASGIYTPMLDLIPEGGSAIIYILQDVNTFCTAAFSNKTVTIKSDPAAGINYYTITSVDTTPIFAIGENAHLILDNINIVSGSFIRFETANVDNATITVDFNSGVTVTASNSSSYPNFIYPSATQNKPVLLTINVNSGAKLGRPANTWAAASGDRNCYLINLNNYGKNLAAGSTINVAGTLEELTSFEGTGARRSSIILCESDADLTVNITPGAVFNYNAGTHGINASEGMIHTCGVVNISGGVFNITGDTSMMPVFWVRATSVYNISGTVIFNAPGLEHFFYSYSATAKVNFNNVTFITNVSDSIQLNHKQSGVSNTPAITVINSTFTNEHVANVLNATVTLDNGNAASGRYDLASAIAAVESGATVYLHANSVVASTIVLDGKAITVAPIGEEALTLALYSNTVGKMFVLKNGASLTLNNLTVTITADTVDRKVETAGSFITVDEAEPTGAVKVNLNNVNLTASVSIPFYFGGNSVVEVVINGGSYVGEGMFAIGYTASESEKGKGDGVDVTSNATVTVTVTGTEDEHVLLRRTAAGDQNAIIFVNFAGKAADHKDQVTFNLTHTDLGREGASSYTHPIYLRGAAALTLNHTCGQFYTGGWLMGGQAGAALYVTLTDVDMTYTGTSYSLRPYGVSGAGSYFKMVGGSVNANRVSDSGYVLSFNADIAVSFTGTTFNVATNAALFSREAGIAPSIVLDGCTFNMTGDIVKSNLPMNVMVKGETKVLVGEELVAITPEIALARGLIVELEGANVYASNLFTAFVAEAKAETNKVLIHGDLALSYPVYITNQNITFAAVGENITISAGAGLRPFYIEDNSTVTFKDLTINAYRFFSFNASDSEVLTTVTLENTDVIVPDYSKDIDAVIYKGHNVGKAVLNIDANSSIVMNSSVVPVPAEGKEIYALIALYKGEGVTINVWGTVKNLMQTAEGKSAQIISIKGSKNNATVNIYDGAVLEGTSSYGKYTSTHGGSYCGIIYFSEGTNTLNIEGGTITVHGVTGLAYTGTKSTVNISGNAVINNANAEYGMFFGANQTVHVTGTDEAKPVINTPVKLIGNGTAYAYNFFTEEEYATLAKTLGFTVLLAGSNTACTTWNATMRNLMTDEETLYLLNDVSSGSNFGSGSLTGKKLTITSYGNTKYTWTTTFSSTSYLFQVCYNTHLIIDNVIMNIPTRFMRFESDGETGGYMKVDIMGGAEIYALPGGDGNFIYYSANRVLTMNIEEGAIIQRKGDSDANTGHLINLGEAFAEGSVINIKGKISDITNYTGTATRGGNLFAVPAANVVVNIYNTAELETALTTETGKIGVVRFAPAGLVYFKNFAEGTDYDKLATGYGLALRADATATTNTAYARNLSAQLIALAESNGTIYALNDFVLSANFTIDNKNVVIETLRDGITMTQSATITLINDSSITVKNLNIISSTRFIDSSTVTNGNTIKLENVKITTSASKDSDIIRVYKSKAAIEITNCEFYSTTNRVILVHATEGGNVTSLKATNVKLNSALLRTGHSTAVIGSAAAPAVLTDINFETILVTGSDGKPASLSQFMLGYFGAIYADIFGGSFKGQFYYGGDNQTNTLQLRVNPTGDKTTTISTLIPSTTSQYSALMHFNPTATADVTLSFRNTTLSDVGGQSALIRVMKTTNLTIYVDNTTFNAHSFLNAYHYCTVYGHFNSAAEAKTFGFNVRLGENVGKGVYYYLVNTAFDAAKDGDTIYLMGNASSINVGTDTRENALFTKKVHITSDGGPYTVNALSGISFYLGEGAELKFTNVIYNLANRLARIDGSCSIIFGAGSVMNHKNTIFIYNNGQETVKGAKYTIDIQPGATINATTKLDNGLIYHNGANTEDNVITVKIAGKINMPVASPIVKNVGYTAKDANGKNYTRYGGRYNIYFDASTADITVGQDLWFANVFRGNVDGAMADDVLWATGFKSHAEADEFGYKHVGAYFRTYDANPEAEYEYSFVLHTQFVDVITGHLTSYGGEVMILRSTQSVYATRHFDFGGVLTFKSYNGAYFGAQDGAYRFRIKNGTTVILDGVEFRTKGGAFMLHQGTAANPSELKLINGAKITSTANIKGASMISFSDNDCANTNLYVDETSSIVLSGANEGSLNMIYVNAGWSGTMTIKGTLTTTAAPTGYVVLINIGGANSTGNIILDGATINLNSTKGTEAIMIDADASNNTGTITIKNATLNNNAVCTATTAFVRTGELVNIEIYAKGLTANFKPTNSYKYSAPFFGTGLVYFKDVTGAEADAMAVKLGTGVRYGDVYSAALSTRMVNLIPVGGSGEIHFLCPAYVPTHITIFNRHVTLVGVENNTDYNYLYTPAANYMFYIQNVGSLIFKNMNVTGARPLINYQAIDAATVAQADRDILISFISSNVKITGSSVLINSGGHHGDVANKICDTITVNIDKNSTIDYTANSSGANVDIYCFSFNHNTHPIANLNIEGTVKFASVGATVRDVFFIRDNNPRTTTVNITETANVTLRVTSTVGGHKFFASATGGDETSNKMNIHMDAITDENGLTIDNFTMFSLYRATNMYDLCITATTDKWTAELQKLITVAAGKEVAAIGAYTEVDGTYYYSSIIGNALISKITDEATVYLLNDCATGKEVVLDGVKVTFTSFGDKIYTATTPYIGSYTIFKVLGDVHMVFENVNFVAGRFARLDNVSKVDSFFKLDVNKGARLVASDPAKDPNFIYGSTTVDRLVTININEGGYMGRPAYNWASAGSAFILNLNSLKMAPGSSVNVAGTFEDLINFTATSGARRTCLVIAADSDLTLNVLPGAVINYNAGRHSINMSQGMFNTAGVVNISGGTFNISGTAEVQPIFWLATGSTYNITGTVTFNAPTLAKLCYSYALPQQFNVTGATILGDVAKNAVLTYTTNYPTLKVVDVTFGNENLASMFGGTACVGEIDAENPLAHRYDFSSAIKIALSKGIELVTITGNTIMNEGIVLNGQTLKLICSAETAPTVNASPNVLKAFTLQNGATLEIRNIKFNLTANTVDRKVETAGVFITADETAPNGTNNVLLDNVTLTASAGIPFYFGGKTIVNLTINGGSYTGEGMFAIGYTCSESSTGKGDGVDVLSEATVHVTITGTHDKHVVLKRTTGGDQNSIIFVNQPGSALANKGKVTFTMTHVDLDSSATSYPMYLRNKAALTVDYTCGKMSSTAWLFASQSACAFYANFTDVDMTSTRTSYIARPYGAAGAGSYINITGGTITGDKVKATEYMMSFNNDIDVTITGVKFVSALGAPVFGSETKTGLSITISDIDITEAGTLTHATKTPILHNNGIIVENDAAAIAKGLFFRVGAEGGKYFHSIASAIAAVADGGVVYMLGNVVEASDNIPLDKYVIIELVNAPASGYTITHTGTGNLFLITGGTASAPARLVMNNIKFTSTTATGAIFAMAENAYAIIELTNCSANTTAGGILNLTGSASAVVTIKGGEYTAYYRPFYIVEDSALQFTATDATFQGLGAGNDGTIFFFNNTNGSTGAVALDFTDCKLVNTKSSGHGIYAMTASKVDLNMTNCTINVKGWCLSSQSNTTWHANFKNVSFTTNSNNHAVRLYGTSGSYLNVEGGTFHQTGTTSTYEGVLSVGNAIVLNFYDGYIESDEIACITALTATVQINIYGGTFRYTGNKDGGAPVALPSRGMITVYGGNFITESSVGPVFSNVANSANSLTLNAFNAYGNVNLITNLGAGTPSADHDAYGRTSLNTIVTTTGATPILTEGAMGLGFKATLDANAYSYLRGLAVDSLVKFGMLVIPTDKLNESRFSHYGFQLDDLVEGVNYYDIKATDADITIADDGCVVIKLALTNISEENYNTAYSVVFYASYDVNFEINGELISTHNVYQYADYERSENSRSLAQVARAAYNDTSATQDSYYVNPVENTTLYSHYTTEELALLATWCGGDTAQKTLDIFLVAGGSNAVGNTVYGNEFASAFDQSSISSNVFYSGMISDYATQTYGATTLRFTAGKYTSIGSTPTLGMGWTDGTMGPEIGMAKELSKYYNSESGKYAAIMKYAFNNINLVDVAGNDMTPAKFYTNFMQMVADQIADYESQGYKVNVVGLYWMQGEADVANVDAYAAAFNTLVSNVRTDLSGITGEDLSSMPVVAGQIANFLGLELNDDCTKFVNMQNTFTNIANVKVDASAQYVADANGIFVNPADVLATGERVAATLITSGKNTLDPDVSAGITVPTIEISNEIYDADGNLFTDADGNPIGFTSIALAVSKAPAGSTIKLTADQIVYASIDFVNAKNITIDGNGFVITVNANAAGIVLHNSNVTLNNFKLNHKGNAVGLKVDANSSVVIDGNSSIIAERTAIELTGAESMLTIKNGEFKTRKADSYKDAIIRTVSAHVTIEGGMFEAAAGGSCVYIGKLASDKLTVNIKGGTFTTIDVVAPVMAADGMQEVDANGVALTASVQAIAFVNEYVLAILVISPDAIVNSSVVSNNVGIGA